MWPVEGRFPAEHKKFLSLRKRVLGLGGGA